MFWDMLFAMSFNDLSVLLLLYSCSESHGPGFDASPILCPLYPHVLFCLSLLSFAIRCRSISSASVGECFVDPNSTSSSRPSALPHLSSVCVSGRVPSFLRAVTAEGSGSEYLQCQQCVQQPEGCQRRLHALMVAQSEGTGGVSAYGLESRKVVEPGWMRQHELDGHPYDKRCPWCVQGRLRQKQHFRQQPGSGTVLAYNYVG